MSVQASIARIQHYLNQAKEDDVKLMSGIKSSAPKVRSALLQIGKLVNESRKLALETGKAIVPKKRITKVEAESKSDETETEKLPESSPILVSDTPSIKPKRGRPKALAVV